MKNKIIERIDFMLAADTLNISQECDLKKIKDYIESMVEIKKEIKINDNTKIIVSNWLYFEMEVL